MRWDPKYRKHERLLVRVAVVFSVVAVVLAFTLTTRLGVSSQPVEPSEVWAYIQEQSAQKDFDPQFVYAIAWAESSLNADARTLAARGMMQMTKPAWKEVTDVSYRHAWDWQTNIRVAIDYLDFCRTYLKQHDSYNYPLLAASYRYGPYYVKDKDFDLQKVRAPKNKIYKQIFSGNIRPVEPPNE